MYDLYLAWFRVADWCAYDLSKDGYEGLVLQPLGAFPKSAATLARSAMGSQDYQHRKIGAGLAGWIEQPTPSLLEELFQMEADRDARMDPKSFSRMDTQSVVEELVFSAVRWARNEKLRPAALKFLADFVERTVNGEYWNTSSYAMTTLVRHSAPGASDLLARFQAYAQGSAPTHPSRPSLTQEKSFAENLLKKNPATLGAIEAVLDQRDQALSAGLDENSRSLIDQLCETARAAEVE